MESPYLTIIVPTWQAGRTIQDSLDSVLCQDFTDLEVLIMDGGSTDETLAIAREVAGRDHRVRLFSAPDKGVYDAMNKGIREARGQWLYFLGSDDLLYDKAVIGTVFALPDHSQFQLLYGDVVSPSYKGAYDGEFSYAKLLHRNLSHQAAFYSRSVFQHLGEYNLRYKGYADWDLNIRCFSDGTLRIRYINRIIAKFGANGLSSRHDVLFLKEVLFPAKLRLLNTTGTRPLRRVSFYDEWWRLLRNAEFRGTETLASPAGATPIPSAVKKMAAVQKKYSLAFLRMGICSKILMFAGYLRSRLTGVI